MSLLVDTAFDGLPGFSRFYLDHAAGRLPGSLRTAYRPDDDGIWTRRREARGGDYRLNAELAGALRMEHRRLGAGSRSLENLDALANGRALAVVTGQQPGVFGGPIHTRLKVATAVALAAWATDEIGISCVPVFWNGADDSDFDEVSQGSLARTDLAVLRFALPSAARRPRTWVGDIGVEHVRDLCAAADAVFSAAGPEGDAARKMVAPDGSVRDFGDWTTSLFLRWFEADGLVVVDARLPEIRRAAAPVFERYLENHVAVHEALANQAAAMEKEGYPPQIDPGTLETALFLTPERERLKLTAGETIAEARRVLVTHPSHLSPNVVLRPLVTDTALPTIAHVAGPAEFVYLSQLAPVYDRLDVFRPIVADRLSVTLLPAEALDLAAGLSVPPRDLLTDPEEAMRRWLDLQIPGEFTRTLAESRQRIEASFDDLRKASRPIDASLVQQIDSAQEKVLFQLGRVSDGVRKKIKHQSELASPRLRNLAEFLGPRRKPQERELSGLTVDLLLGDAAFARVAAAADDHVRRLTGGGRSHTLVEIP